MNPYNTTPPPSSRPWWKTTPALLGLLALVAVLSAVSFPLGFLVMIGAMVAAWALPAWRWYAKLGATFGAFFLMLISAGVSGQLDDSGPDKSVAGAQDTDDKAVGATPSPTQAKVPELTDYTGKSLAEAEKGARAADFTPGRHDASPGDRAIVVRSAWTVCFQTADTTAKSVVFAAVKDGEPCPTKDGAPLPWPTMPDVVGDTYNTAVKALDQAGIDLDSVTLDDVYLDLEAPTADEAAEEGDEWRVCFQRPDENSEVTPTTTVHLDLGEWTDADVVQKCPAKKDTTYKIPAGDPNYGGHSDSDDNSTTGGDSSTSSGGSTGGGGVGVVHPGSFCSPAGATGVTKKGTPMVCGPGSDGRDRWHSS
ncbi:PASTA domain-containing protein [Streptomyces sp. BBFR51]|uniref:PASTA domain-containing protein n=1 Tax=Streptomyces sp. BBFR51 TaxID=3372856 RepID=UPI0037DDA0AD